MDDILILIVMLSCGFVGGYINYIIYNDFKGISGNRATKSIVTGITAAFMVPLLLNIISNSLFTEITTGKKIYIFIGLCLLASITSRRFIQSMTNQWYKRVERLENEVRTISDSQSEPEVIVHDLSENSENSELQVQEDRISKYNVLTYLSVGRYSFRSISGISRDLDCTEEFVLEKLSELQEMGYADQAPGDGFKRGRWFATPKGREALWQHLHDKDVPA